VPRFNPKDADMVIVTSTVTWKSVDGGKTWTGFRGAPGGDDYQNLWINPNNPQTMIIVSDQGAIVTVNGGETWSSWYNQPTAQMYHVNADNAFPTGCAAASRKAVLRAFPAAGMTARSPCASGIPWRRKNTVMSS
jgi:Uncharacterized protein related to plant photosystem II stability/assembly factor